MSKWITVDEFLQNLGIGSYRSYADLHLKVVESSPVGTADTKCVGIGIENYRKARPKSIYVTLIMYLSLNWPLLYYLFQALLQWPHR